MFIIILIPDEYTFSLITKITLKNIFYISKILFQRKVKFQLLTSSLLNKNLLEAYPSNLINPFATIQATTVALHKMVAFRYFYRQFFFQQTKQLES